MLDLLEPGAVQPKKGDDDIPREEKDVANMDYSDYLLFLQEIEHH